MPPPPLLGYNNNVRHRGRIFHIQTEDSGTGSPRIMTHLFADGGRIVKSTRTDYSEHLERDDMVSIVKNMMKEQHKAMFVALRSGELDELIGFGEDEPKTLAGVSIKPLAEQFIKDAGRAAQAVVVEGDKGSGPARVLLAPEPDTQKATAVDGFAEVPAAAAAPSVAKPYAPSRPASIFSVPPPNSASIFGQVAIDEKSLDDAILSYLAEDDGKATPKK